MGSSESLDSNELVIEGLKAAFVGRTLSPNSIAPRDEH